MQRFEYRVVPAPRKGEKARGAKTTGDRFALALTHLMNEMGADGWEYLRADTLPCEERVGLTGKTTSFQNMLVFRRAQAAAVQTAPVEGHAAAPVVPTVSPGDAPAPAVAPAVAPVERPVEGAARPVGPAAGEGGKAPALGPARPEMAAE
ncbi:DUF4177 domain-containing protein [Aliigemmobacter aestuarii]|uniref:DUF4177 domain-containing protein n=1 Tax=Aliigemmobacter aestuarii TaxID=1445661 RepID=A0A4S3MKZ5_9RHOB|nr:DUF4177 domain-containing protein [Gemmobacter aestuarii]THD82230.1 DUF4177 domain-containing protein [Gemmobacter aestuarii]